MNPPFNLRELRFFVAAAEQGGRLPAAAVSLNVSPPVLAQAISRMESRCEVVLFERGGLTAAGETLYEKARAAVRAADAAVATVGPWARGESRVRLGFPSSAEMLARPLRRRFAQRCPLIEVESTQLRGGERLAALRDGRIDLELAFPPPRAGDLVAAPVLSSPRYAVLAERHPLAAQSAVRFAEIAQSALVGDREFAGERREAPGMPRRDDGTQVEPRWDDGTQVELDRLWALVCSGRAVGVLPRFMLPRAVGDGVRAIPLLDVEPLDVVLVRRREDDRQAVAALLELAAPAAEPGPRMAGRRPVAA